MCSTVLIHHRLQHIQDEQIISHRNESLILRSHTRCLSDNQWELVLLSIPFPELEYPAYEKQTNLISAHYRGFKNLRASKAQCIYVTTF